MSYSTSIEPYPHQTKISKEGEKILREHMIVYFAMEERTGKSLINILIAERLNSVRNVLIVTTLKASDGWNDLLKNYKTSKSYTIINYESLHKVKSEYDFVIIDEAHKSISSFPKVSKTWKQLKFLTSDIPIAFNSATPSSQSLSMLFHQLHLSDWSPFAKYKNFYNWHREYGIESIQYISGRLIKEYQYTKEDKVWNDCNHLFISYTRKELGFKEEPNDVVHYISLDSDTKNLYNELVKTKMIQKFSYIADSVMKERVGLHQIEGGTLKINDTKSISFSREKIDYIKEHWGDYSDIVIFYNYVYEGIHLKNNFKHCKILQGTSYAEGIDLHKYSTSIVYSMDFQTAKYSQRRARQCNMNRFTAIDVHYLLVKDAISDQCYTTVAKNKQNFIDRYYNENLII